MNVSLGKAHLTVSSLTACHLQLELFECLWREQTYPGLFFICVILCNILKWGRSFWVVVYWCGEGWRSGTNCRPILTVRLQKHNQSHSLAHTHSLSTHSLSTHSISTHSISTHSRSTHSLSTHSLSTHSLSTHSISTHSISTHLALTHLALT